MDSIIRGTTPSLIVDFSGVTAFTVSDITAVALTVKQSIKSKFLRGNAGSRGWVVNAAKTSSGVSYRLMRSASTGTDLQVQLIMAGLYN